MTNIPNANSRPAKFDLTDPSLLTARQKEVKALIMNGLTSLEAAGVLGISRRTVEFHRAHVQRKFGARNGTHLAFLISTLQPPLTCETIAFV
ncbi:MAG: two component transcriptional regulator, LuxR family, partial [Hyphomicrobiales bacterium]|nr:two component transcriptional regulator, LuxR family [Hyphomicrobiales bacterium]